MAWLAPVLWGLFGGFAMDSLDFITAVRRHHRLPWRSANGNSEPGLLAYGIAVVLRLALGAGLAGAASASVPGGVSAWLAVGLGVAAPTVLEKLTTLIPLTLRAGLTVLAGQALVGAADQDQESAPGGTGGEAEAPRPASALLKAPTPAPERS
jgi:hypothetical protein